MPLWLSVVLGITALIMAGVSPEAAPESLPSERDFLQDLPVVLSVSRLRQPISETPSAVTVIDRQTIRASGARELSDLFRLVPGFYVGYFNGHQPIVSYHGLTDQFSRRMQVLVDGRSVYMPPTGGVDWNDLPLALEDIERIEVIRGPSAATHGANSFLGVISVITRHPSQTPGAYLSYTRGSKGIEDGVLRYGGRGPSLDYRVTLGLRSDDGFDQVNDSKRVRFLTLRADSPLNASDRLELQLGLSSNRQGMGFPDDEIDPLREVPVRSHFEQVRFSRVFSPESELSVQFYHAYRKLTDVGLTLPIAPLGNQRFPLDDSSTGRRYDLELQHSISPSPQWRWVWGAGARRDEAVAPANLQGAAASALSRLFAHGEWRATPRLLLNAGAMLEHNDITGTDLSPRVALIYHLAPGHSLRAGIGSALRTPVLLEEEGNRRFVFGPALVQRFLSSGGLKPEKIISREIGYVASLAGNRLTLDARLFHDTLFDLIGVVVVPYPPAYNGVTRDLRNGDGVRQSGLETQLKLKPDGNTLLLANAAHVVTESADTMDTYSLSAPVNAFSLLASHRFPGGFSVSAAVYQQGAMKPLGPGEPLPLTRRFDLRLAQRWRAPGAEGEIAFVVQNLFNHSYPDFREDNVFDRRSYLTMSLRF